MSNLYSNYDKFYKAVDCIIFGFLEGELKILLMRRDLEPKKDQWSLVGGFVNEDETLHQAAERVLYDMTGLKNIYMEQLNSFSEVDRDEEARVISTPFYALIKIENLYFSSEYRAQWFSITNYPRPIFDHEDMIQYALRKMRHHAQTEPIGFALLPEKFTMPQLRTLYESIYQQPFDKRNFSKKMISLGLLDRLDEKEFNSSKKGAYYFKFNVEKYNELLQQGTYLKFI